MSAVQVKPGRTSGISPSICIVTLKLVAVWPRLPGGGRLEIGLLPTSVTLPVNVLSGMASMLHLGELADLHDRDVGLVDLDLGLDDRHVGDGAAAPCRRCSSCR